MNKQDMMIIEAFEARAKRREERRAFFRVAGGASVAIAGASLLSACGGDDDSDRPLTPPTGGPSAAPQSSDVAVLNFALNLEYLEAQFYSFAAFGEGLAGNLLTGTGVQGSVTGGKKVNFTDQVVAQYAREIAIDERNHVAFLRQALGASAVAQPPLDIGSAPNGAFSSAARASGLIGAGASFDPYANDENFLLGAYIFEDVGVTAYKGASPLITNKTFLEAAAGILAAEAYHAGLIRTVLFAKGLQTPALIDATEKISDARDSLDGASDLDQGVRERSGASNIVPADANAIAFSRSAAQVLNIVFLTKLMAQQGGFFPQGVNGSINASAANG